MDLSINLREIQGVAVLDLNGRLVLGEECNTVRRQLMQLLEAHKNKVLFNMGNVTRVDSSGIGFLVEALILVTKDGGQFKLSNLPRLLHNTLALHRLLPAFEIFAKEDDALASFK